MFTFLSTPTRATTTSVVFFALNLILASTNLQECSGFANIQSTVRSQRSSFTQKEDSRQPLRHQRWAYGKNAEIWPETNEDPVKLSDSFPNGEVPYSAIMMIEQQDMETYHENVEDSISHDDDNIAKEDGAEVEQSQRRRGVKRQFVSRSIRRILRRAAAKEELDSEPESTGLDKTPILIAAALLVRGLVRPLDVALVGFLTAYGVILGQVARSPRETSGVPVLPATPPQGHVPTMVSNPLGMGIMYSKVYDLWLKLGVLIGLVGPVALISHYVFFAENLAAARICAPPIFLLCCQAISEAMSRKIMTPLPLRILVPVAYNTARLPYLWRWIFHASESSPLGVYGKALGVANGLYWAANLFAFLIPVATIRYMRAHFFGVEAMEVTTRIGMEETVGLIPNQ